MRTRPRRGWTRWSAFGERARWCTRRRWVGSPSPPAVTGRCRSCRPTTRVSRHHDEVTCGRLSRADELLLTGAGDDAGGQAAEQLIYELAVSLRSLHGPGLTPAPGARLRPGGGGGAGPGAQPGRPVAGRPAGPDHHAGRRAGERELTGARNPAKPGALSYPAGSV